MTKSLDPARPPGPQLRRALLAEIRKAQAALAGAQADDVVVHAVRRACKRARACLRLLRPAWTGHEFRCVDDEVRQAARMLAPARDAAVVRRTAHEIGIPEPELPAVAPLAGPPRADAAAALERARAAVPRHCTLTADELGRAVARVYRQARRRRAALGSEPDDAGFHALRRAVKHHAHHVRLLRGVWPEYFEVWWKRLDALAELLGREHDLTVLREVLAAEPDAPDVATSARLHASQNELRAQALREAALLLAERPRALSERLAAYWRAAATAQDGSGTRVK